MLKDTKDLLSNALKGINRATKFFGKSFLTKLFFPLNFSVFEFLLTRCNETSDFIVGQFREIGEIVSRFLTIFLQLGISSFRSLHNGLNGIEKEQIANLIFRERILFHDIGPLVEPLVDRFKVMFIVNKTSEQSLRFFSVENVFHLFLKEGKRYLTLLSAKEFAKKRRNPVGVNWFGHGFNVLEGLFGTTGIHRTYTRLRSAEWYESDHSSYELPEYISWFHRHDSDSCLSLWWRWIRQDGF